MKKILLAVLVLIGLQTQAQINYCDSISYTTSSTMNYPLIVTGDASPFINMVDSIVWSWQVCNSTMCYTGSGTIASFGQVLTTDTLKVCYDAYIYLMGATYICTSCDSLVYDQNSYSWVLFNTGNPTSITELTSNTINNGTIYDLLGREVTDIALGTMYIRNNKKYIRVR
jgi:hypothetical protein